MLFGQHRAHQAPRRQPVGEDAHHVPFRGQALRRRNSRFSRSCGLLDHSFCQWATGKAVKARMSGAASASSSATWGKGSRSCSTTRSNWPWTSAGDSCRWMVGTMVATPALRQAQEGALGDSGEQVGHDVGAAALLTHPGEHRGDGILQPPCFRRGRLW